jgi:poly(A) polymerase
MIGREEERMLQAAVDVVRRLRAAGHEAWLVGGCVRDLLLGFEPEDWDVATSARPEEAATLFERSRAVGRSFGVLQVLAGGRWLEVATFRTEGPYSDGRHPDSVRFADIGQDAARRDFTINALFMDPDSGRVLDLVGGRADLQRRLVRCVGRPDERFAEDGLRLLRAVRFACRLGFEVEADTRQALQRQAARLAAVSPERVRDEFLAILTGPAPRRGLVLLQETGLLQRVLPEVAALRGVTQSSRRHPEGDVWEHTLCMLDGLRDPDPALALGVLLHDIGKPATRRLQAGEPRFPEHAVQGARLAQACLARLRLPSRLAETARLLVAQHRDFDALPRLSRSALRRFVLQEHFPRLLELHRLDRLAAGRDLDTFERCRRELELVRRRPAPLQPLLDGDALMALGFRPGPRLGRILDALVDAQLEDEVGDPESARRWVLEHHAPDAPPGPRDAGLGGPAPDAAPGGPASPPPRP